MKNRNIFRLLFVAALAIVSGPLALAALFGFLTVPALGTSYPVANATTKGDLTTQSANLEQEIRRSRKHESGRPGEAITHSGALGLRAAQVVNNNPTQLSHL